VKFFVRSLLLWLLVLALPFQGFASARMLACAPVAAPAQAAHDHQAMMLAMQGKPHDHAAMLRAMAGQAAHTAHDGHDGHHESAKPGSCAACCIGAAMAPIVLPSLALLPPASTSIPFRAGHVPSVDPVLPERPPRTTLA